MLTKLNSLLNSLDPKYILFKKEYNLKNGKGPLFKSQTQLADFIVTTMQESYSVDSLKPFLSQVLKHHTDRQSRPLPEKLKAIIIAACIKQFGDNKTEISKFIIEFNESISEWKINESIPKSTNATIWKSFKKWCDSADEHHIFTHAPAELKWEHHSEAKELVNNLSDRIIIGQSRVKYNFYLPTTQIGLEFWKNITKYLKVVKNLSESEVDQYLQIVDTNNSIQVFMVPSVYCSPHMSLMKLNKPLSSEYSLFMFSYLGNDDLSVTQSSAEDMAFWYSDRFLSLKNEIDRRKIKITYDDSKKSMSMFIPKGVARAGN